MIIRRLLTPLLVVSFFFVLLSCGGGGGDGGGITPTPLDTSRESYSGSYSAQVWDIITEPWGTDDTSLQNYPEYSNPDWMARLKNETLISKLSIPGTHETLARYNSIFSLHAQCNTLPLIDQLNAGIRLIDIRCRWASTNPDPNTFIEIWHGIIYQYALFNRDVLEVCKFFLERHPSETIFMRVQQTGGKRFEEFWTRFKEAVENDLGSDGVIWDGSYYDGSPAFSKIPSLGEVRGKIVILQEFTPIETDRPVLGLEYTNGGLFDLQTGKFNEFGLYYVKSKFDEFLEHALHANSLGNDKIVVTSFGGGIYPLLDSTPKIIALGCNALFCGPEVGMNKRLYDSDVLATPPKDISLGMISLDFPGGGLIRKIIDLNFAKPVITLLGGSKIVLECGADTFSDPGATVEDDFDSDIRVKIGGDIVDPMKPGIYIITYDATDSSGNAADQVTRTVIVQDTLPPVFRSLSATPDLLWPPNHKLVPVNFHADVVDLCDSEPRVVLTAVSSNELKDNWRGGDDNEKRDIQNADIGMPDFSILLRAERLGNGDSRIYWITYSATDHSGNRVTRETTVTVPHDDGLHR